MAVSINAKGTTHKSFRIGKRGATIFQGTEEPTNASNSDLWIDEGSLSLKLYNGSTGQFEGISGGSNQSLTELSDVTLTSPVDGEVLSYNGTDWVNTEKTPTKIAYGIIAPEVDGRYDFWYNDDAGKLYFVMDGQWVQVCDTTPPPTNVYIENPGFESDFAGWTVVEPVAISGIPYVGSKSLKLSGTGASASQDVTINTSTNYKLTAYVMGNARVAATVDGVTYEAFGTGSDEYHEVSLTFDSGSANLVTIFTDYFAEEGRVDAFTLVGNYDSTVYGSTIILDDLYAKKEHDHTVSSLSDVNVTNLSGGHGLEYDVETGTWIASYAGLISLGYVRMTYKGSNTITDTTPSEGRVSRNSNNPEDTTILYFHRVTLQNHDVRFYFNEVSEGDWLNIFEDDDFGRGESYDVTGSVTYDGDTVMVPVKFYSIDGQGIDEKLRVNVMWRIGGSGVFNKADSLSTLKDVNHDAPAHRTALIYDQSELTWKPKHKDGNAIEVSGNGLEEMQWVDYNVLDLTVSGNVSVLMPGTLSEYTRYTVVVTNVSGSSVNINWVGNVSWGVSGGTATVIDASTTEIDIFTLNGSLDWRGRIIEKWWD